MARREQFHQTVLVSNLDDYSNATQSYLHGVQAYLSAVAQAGHGALAALYLQVHRANNFRTSGANRIAELPRRPEVVRPAVRAVDSAAAEDRHISDADLAMTPH